MRSTSARMRRATPVQLIRPMATIMVTTAPQPCGLTTPMSVASSNRPGIDRTISTSRLTMASSTPPK